MHDSDRPTASGARGATYRVIDHTADVGIAVFGADARALFTHAAMAMFDLILDVAGEKPALSGVVRTSGDDWADLMVNWLRELLYVWAGKGQVVRSVDIDHIGKFHVSAGIAAEPFDSRRHRVNMEIKAVTYHQIDVRRTRDGWTAMIIFDA
jgi:SHS2 domain-containing protein